MIRAANWVFSLVRRSIVGLEPARSNQEKKCRPFRMKWEHGTNHWLVKEIIDRPFQFPTTWLCSISIRLRFCLFLSYRHHMYPIVVWIRFLVGGLSAANRERIYIVTRIKCCKEPRFYDYVSTDIYIYFNFFRFTLTECRPQMGNPVCYLHTDTPDASAESKRKNRCAKIIMKLTTATKTTKQ